MDSRRLRYVTGDQLKANGVDLGSAPIAVEGERRPFGELDGAVIDINKRRVCYLVVEMQQGARQMLPLDVTRLNSDGVLMTSRNDVDASEPFEPSAYGRYDDEAVMSLLFGSRPA